MLDNQALQEAFGQIATDVYNRVGSFIAEEFQKHLSVEGFTEADYINVALSILAGVTASHLISLANYCGFDQDEVVRRFHEGVTLQLLDMKVDNSKAN